MEYFQIEKGAFNHSIFIFLTCSGSPGHVTEYHNSSISTATEDCPNDCIAPNISIRTPS